MAGRAARSSSADGKRSNPSIQMKSPARRRYVVRRCASWWECGERSSRFAPAAATLASGERPGPLPTCFLLCLHGMENLARALVICRASLPPVHWASGRQALAAGAWAQVRGWLERRREIEELKMWLRSLSVTNGSRISRRVHRAGVRGCGQKKKRKQPPVVLVGKASRFDTVGPISLSPATAMDHNEVRTCCGAASVFARFFPAICAELKQRFKSLVG